LTPVNDIHARSGRLSVAQNGRPGMSEFELTRSAERPYFFVEKSCSMQPDDISRTMGEAFGDV
jgi:hypothetical protein